MLQEAPLYYDPFMEEGVDPFDAAAAFEQIVAEYQAGSVEHDFTADEFLAKTEALMLDAHFLGQFETMQSIAQRMELLCAHDHELQEAMQNSAFFGADHRHKDGHHHEDDDKKKAKKKKSDTKEQGRQVGKERKPARALLALLARKPAY